MNQITRTLLADVQVFSELDDVTFPKLIGDGIIVSNAGEQDLVDVPADTEVLVPKKQLAEEFGVDFPACVLVAKGRKSAVLYKDLPEPVLSLTLDDGSPLLEWTSAFQIPTFIYRTEVYESGTAQPEFELIARVEGTSTPGGTVSYHDITVELADDTESVAYYVLNDNGTSDVVEETGE